MYEPDTSAATPCLGHRVSPSRPFLSFGVRRSLRASLRGSLNLKHRAAGFSLLEVMFAMAIVGVLVMSLYAAIVNSISWIKVCQENGRVTQILSDKLDTIRLYNWTQINSNSFVPTSFVVGIDPFNTNSTPYYTGTISIAEAPNPLNAYYKSNILQVTVRVDWVSGSRPQNRSMDTYVTKYGLQSYIMR